MYKLSFRISTQKKTILIISAAIFLLLLLCYACTCLFSQWPSLPPDQVLYEDREICIRFVNETEPIGDYENVEIKTYYCNDNVVIDSYITFECPTMKLNGSPEDEIRSINIGIDRVCRFWIVHEKFDSPRNMVLNINSEGRFSEN